MGRIRNKKEQLKFALYCYKRGQDGRFVKNVRELGGNDNLVYVETYGNKRTNDAVYFIDMEASHSGFFADHNRLLALLYFADKYDMKPVVRYSDGYCYAEKHPVNGTDNPFEYYFEQPAGISLDELGSYKRVFKSRKENSYEVNKLCKDPNGYMRSEEYLNEMARITASYIRLNPIIKPEMEREISALLGGGKILGVHVRGTDFKQNFNGHPVMVSADEYLDASIETFEKGGYDKVFLATDDIGALSKYRGHFKDKLLFYEAVVRGGGDDTVMHSSLSRENHKYLLGYEVLRDMYTLSECGGLIAGLSQVSYASRIQKKSVGEEYGDLVILDKGINFHKKNNCP